MIPGKCESCKVTDFAEVEVSDFTLAGSMSISWSRIRAYVHPSI